MSSFDFKPQQIGESVDSHGHDHVPEVRSRSIARGLPFGRGIRVIEQESHVLVFRAIQEIGQIRRIEPDTRRLAGIRNCEGFLTLSNSNIRLDSGCVVACCTPRVVRCLLVP